MFAGLALHQRAEAIEEAGEERVAHLGQSGNLGNI